MNKKAVIGTFSVASATGLSEAREAAGAIAEPRIACFLRSKKPPKE